MSPFRAALLAAQTFSLKSCNHHVLEVKFIYGAVIHYRARGGEWRIYFDPAYIYVSSSLQAQTSGTLSPDTYHWY